MHTEKNIIDTNCMFEPLTYVDVQINLRLFAVYQT